MPSDRERKGVKAKKLPVALSAKLEKEKEQLDKDREKVTKLQKKKQKKLNNVNSMAKKQLEHQPESVPMSKKGALKNGGRWKRR